jgi:hypothetical protein
VDKEFSRSEIIELLSDYVRGQVEEDQNKFNISITRRDTSFILNADFSEIDNISRKLSELQL